MEAKCTLIFIIHTEANNATISTSTISKLHKFKEANYLLKQWQLSHRLENCGLHSSGFTVLWSGESLSFLRTELDFQIFFDKSHSTPVACHFSISTHTHLLFTKLHRNRSLYHTMLFLLLLFRIFIDFCITFACSILHNQHPHAALHLRYLEPLYYTTQLRMEYPFDSRGLFLHNTVARMISASTS